MAPRSIFSDEWYASQRAYFQQAARSGDAETRADALRVMRELGFSEKEITDLYVEATMHADDLPDDFVPDVGVIEALRETPPHPLECTCPDCNPHPKPPAE